MLQYRPRRASKRWLQDAPEYVLSVHDNGGKTWDRYTVCFGGSNWEPSLGRNVLYIGMSENPNHPQGFGQHGEMCSHARTDPKIRWLDLPLECRLAVFYSGTYGTTARAVPPGLRGGFTGWLAQHRATDDCGWSDVVNDAGEPIQYATEISAKSAAEFHGAAWRLSGPPRV